MNTNNIRYINLPVTPEGDINLSTFSYLLAKKLKEGATYSINLSDKTKVITNNVIPYEPIIFEYEKTILAKHIVPLMLLPLTAYMTTSRKKLYNMISLNKCKTF